MVRKDNHQFKHSGMGWGIVPTIHVAFFPFFFFLKKHEANRNVNMLNVGIDIIICI